MLGRQQFQHYPLSNKQLTNIMQQRQTLEKNIHENLTEMRMLNSKMTKNENQMIYLKRLQDREKVLNNQKRQMEEILRTHQYLQNQADSIMKSEHNFRATLGGQYRAAMEEKKNKQQQDKRRRIEQQQMLLHLNKRSIQIDQEKKKKQMLETKKRFNQQLIQFQIQRQHEKDQKQRQKEQFNINLAKKYSQQTQKDAAYKQYYNQFLINKSLPKNTYPDKATIETNQKEKPRSQSTQKQRLDLNREQVRIYEDQSTTNYTGKQTLKSYLSQQINEKQRRKQEQAQNKRVFNQQYSNSQQSSQKEYQQQARQKKRDQQRKYQEELTNQIRQKQTIFRQRQSSPHRFYNNNVSPIDMKLKDTYGGNKYEEMNERSSGQREFKMRNLAVVGSNSIQ